MKERKEQRKMDYGNLNKTQEVLYGREFKRADQAYRPNNAKS
ncbi:MAG TPA: YfhE family protein [Bacillales bacterium]|nr:YfhE family protein [Bacillales bacterium]